EQRLEVRLARASAVTLHFESEGGRPMPPLEIILHHDDRPQPTIQHYTPGPLVLDTLAPGTWRVQARSRVKGRSSLVGESPLSFRLETGDPARDYRLRLVRSGVIDLTLPLRDPREPAIPLPPLKRPQAPGPAELETWMQLTQAYRARARELRVEVIRDGVTNLHDATAEGFQLDADLQQPRCQIRVPAGSVQLRVLDGSAVLVDTQVQVVAGTSVSVP
ncbi:MAG: hypothetical protein KDB53_01825, partial [Planctomycetes bacterium]|nr:hypothetical protein [Planctomycetota bacterium]